MSWLDQKKGKVCRHRAWVKPTRSDPLGKSCRLPSTNLESVITSGLPTNRELSRRGWVWRLRSVAVPLPKCPLSQRMKAAIR